MSRLLALTGLVAGLLACESGTAETHSFTLSDSTVDAFSEEAPGLLRVAPGVARVLCGDPIEASFDVYFDLGLGCLDDDLKGTEVSRSAWVEPAPEGFDLDALCALPLEDRRPVSLPVEITGEDHVGSVEPQPDWIQAESSGEWKRASICGGHLRVEHAL